MLKKIFFLYELKILCFLPFFYLFIYFMFLVCYGYEIAVKWERKEEEKTKRCRKDSWKKCTIKKNRCMNRESEFVEDTYITQFMWDRKRQIASAESSHINQSELHTVQQQKKKWNKWKIYYIYMQKLEMVPYGYILLRNMTFYELC